MPARTAGLAAAELPLILHVIYRLQPGGMENGIVNLVNRLPAARYRHAIACLTEATDFAERIQPGRADIFELHKRPGKDPGVYRRFWQLVRRLRPAIVHTRNLGALDLAPVAALAGAPVRLHGEHGWDIGDPGGMSRKYRVLRRACDRAVTGYVAVSQDIAGWLERRVGIAPARVRQIYNGVDTDRFRPNRRSRAPRDVLTIGSVGRMDPIKNFPWLVDTLAALLAGRPSLRSRLRLVLVGDGADLPRVREHVARHGLDDVVELPGQLDDVPAVLAGFDLFVLPSINEGISNTILESMAAGLPVIASQVGGNAELVVDGSTGVLFASGDGEALRDAILRFVESPDLIAAAGDAARRRALERFSLERMVERYAEMYDEYLLLPKNSGLH